MPIARIEPRLDMHYRVDDYTEPWRKPEAVLMVHGNREGSMAWYGWVPTLARHYRVVRPDTRGFADSTPMPRDFPWSMDLVIDDFVQLMDSLGIERFHLISAKIGGTIARAFAARRPDRVSTLTVIGTPQALRPGAENIPSLIEEFENHGSEHWARRTMGGRLGDRFPAEGVEWWTKFMGRTAVSTLIGFNKHINYADIRADLPKIACPTLVIVTEESGLGSVDKTRAWQEMIPDSELLVLPGRSYHVAATHAEDCARATMDFIERRRALAQPAARAAA